MKKGKYIIRFNLGRGVNYLKWKVTNPNGDVSYYDPNDYQFEMGGCMLKNRKKTSTKIYEGSNKEVCSFIYCDDLIIHKEKLILGKSEHIRFNPRVKPFWFNERGEDVDGCFFDVLFTEGNKVKLIK